LLLSMNVGVNTVDKIVRAVLEKLGSIKVDLFWDDVNRGQGISPNTGSRGNIM
jgi:hypothetical protein